ncbi:MAG: methyltransferase domain-containing protein [Patescibacteria group bacterium]
MTTFLDPEKIIDHIDIRPGMRVADFGCGHGYYAIPIAKRVGNSGKVYAFDVQQTAVDALRTHAQAQRLGTIEVRRVNLEEAHSTGLADGVVNLVLIANILFQAEDKKGLLAEAARILARDGSLAVIEWRKEGGSASSQDALGPPVHLRVSQEEIKSMMEEKGFHKEREFDAGEWHYGIIFKK